MEAIERLQKQWRDSAQFRGLHASVSLEKDALVLGVGTVLAKRDGDGGLTIEGDEARLLTLLAVACGQTVDSSMLATIRAASKYARAGDECMAAMRIALAPLPQLADPEDAARRLFIADGLIAAGVALRDIWRALEFDPAPLDELEKYSPSELRNPKGDGRISGQWTNGSAAAADDITAESLSSRIASLAARLLGRASGRTAGLAVPVVGELLAMTNSAGNWPTHGEVPGRPDLRYKWDQDENRLYVFRGSDPYPLIQAVPYASEFRDRRGRKVARLTETGIKFDLKILPPEWPSPEELRDNPQQCPTQGPDLPGRPGKQGERDRDYADHVKAQINVPPTPRDIGYWLNDPVDELPVILDDCQHQTGLLVEIKGDYSGFMATAWGRKQMGIDWAYQATRQWESSGGRPIEWHFANKEAADFARVVFNEHEWLRGIRVVWTPWIGHEK